MIIALPEGMLRAVLCKRCNRRQTVFLGGRRDREGLTAPVPPAPRQPVTPAPPPPIETRRVRKRRG